MSTIVAFCLLRRCFIIVMTAAASSASVARGEIIYNALTAFATASNPNGVWAYGYAAEPNSQLINFPDNGTSGSAPFWTDNTIGLANIAFWRNDEWNGGLGVPNNQSNSGESWLVMHPGPGTTNDHILLRFLAPESGLYTVQFEYLPGDNGAVSVWMLQDGNVSLPLYQALGTGSGGSWSSSTPILLAGGGTIDLVIGNAGSHQFDSTPVRLTITAIPESNPASAGVFGLAVFSAWRRPRQRKT